MGKMVIFLLLAAFLLGLAWIAVLKTHSYFKRERNKDFQDTLENTIKADAASERLEAAYEREQAREQRKM